jgi:hypothetical protein
VAECTRYRTIAVFLAVLDADVVFHYGGANWTALFGNHLDSHKGASAGSLVGDLARQCLDSCWQRGPGAPKPIEWSCTRDNSDPYRSTRSG